MDVRRHGTASARSWASPSGSQAYPLRHGGQGRVLPRRKGGVAPHHAHRRGAQGLPAADGKRRGAYDEAPDTEPEEAANGAESTDEPDGEDNGQWEARQTSDPSPLDQFTRPCRRNVNDASNFARLIKYFSGDLVIGLPDPSDSKPAVGRGRSKALPDIYAIDSRGMLSSARAGSLLLKTGRLYYAECYGLEGAERHACADDARKLGNDGVLERLCGVAEAAVHDLRDAGALPRGLVVKCKSEIDCHLNYIGTPKGVLDLRTGHIVPPTEGPARIHRIPPVLCGPHRTQGSDLGQNGPNSGGQCTGGGAGHSTGSLPRNRRQTRLRNRDLPGIPLDRLGRKETRMARPHSQYPRGSRPRPPKAPCQAALKTGAQTGRDDPESSSGPRRPRARARPTSKSLQNARKQAFQQGKARQRSRRRSACPRPTGRRRTARKPWPSPPSSPTRTRNAPSKPHRMAMRPVLQAVAALWGKHLP